MPNPDKELTELQRAMIEHDDEMARLDRNTVPGVLTMTNSTTDIPILDDDQLARIERESYAASRADVRALCQTVRVLREQLATANKQRDDALVRAAEDQDEHSSQRAVLVAQLEQVTKERDAAREVATAITIEKQKVESVATSMRSACVGEMRRSL